MRRGRMRWGSQRNGKRALDVLAAGPALLGALPALAALAIAVRLEDGGPAFFTQERVGLERVPFRLVKLRTMRDGRVTRIGRFLRATGLDELPQLAHVLRGEMSLVGPRPLTRSDIDRLGWDGEGYDHRFSVPPGITGLAQLAPRCDAELSARCDRQYVERSSARYDVAILGASLLVPLVGKSRATRILSSALHEGA